MIVQILFVFFFSSRRRHTRLQGDWSSDVCSSDYLATFGIDFTLGQVIKPGTFNRVIERLGDADGRTEIMEQLLRTQMQARYGPERLGHFGLGPATHAHFTSPVRRHADLPGHRS